MVQQMKKSKTMEGTHEEDSTILCTPDLHTFYGLNEEETFEVDNIVTHTAHFAENALVAEKDLYSLGLGFTKSQQK